MSKNASFFPARYRRPTTSAPASRLGRGWWGEVQLSRDATRDADRRTERSTPAATRLAGIGYRFALAVAMILAGAGVVFHGGNVATPVDIRQEVAASGVDRIPTLPTVHVSARAPVPVLPTVLVHASETERAAALADDPDSLIASATDRRGGGDLPHVYLDMPYYSFGKVLPRISKE